MKINGDAALGEVLPASKPSKFPSYCKLSLEHMKLETKELTPNPQLEHLQSDYLRSELDQLKEKLQQATNKSTRGQITKYINDKQWTLDNLPILYRNECVLTYPLLVCGLQNNPMRGWLAKAWISEEEHLIVEVEDHYVSWLLTDIAYNCGKYHKATTNFAKIEKYHRQMTLDEMSFFKFMKTSEDTYDLVDVNMTKVLVSAATAKKRIEPSLLHFVTGDPEGWTHLSFTSSSRSGTVAGSVLSPDVLTRNPTVQYKNSGNQCLLMALASGLAHMGKPEMAKLIASVSEEYAVRKCGVQFSEFVDIVRRVLRVDCFKAKYKNGLTQDVRRNNPVVVSLKGWKDDQVCSLRHCICFVGQFAFDSNFDVALDITKKNLDLICDNVIDGASYKGIYWAREVMVTPREPGKK